MPPAALITFDEILLNPEYSAFARGGVEYATSHTRSPMSGVHFAYAHRLEGLWRGVIDYSEMAKTELEALDNFFHGGFGDAIGFRFIPPYNRTLVDEPIATANGSTSYKIYKNFRRPGSARVDKKRICKPVGPGLFLSDGVTARPWSMTTKLNGVTQPGGNWTLDSTTGLLVWAGAGGAQPNAGQTIQLSCEFDLPMLFNTSHFDASVDETTISEFRGIPIIEISPAALGIAY